MALATSPRGLSRKDYDDLEQLITQVIMEHSAIEIKRKRDKRKRISKSRKSTSLNEHRKRTSTLRGATLHSVVEENDEEKQDSIASPRVMAESASDEGASVSSAATSTPSSGYTTPSIMSPRQDLNTKTSMKTKEIDPTTESPKPSAIEERTCAACNEKITSTFVKALDCCWHLDHFRCKGCGVSLAETDFYDISATSPACKACKDKVMVCKMCDQPLGSVYLRDREGNMLHEKCAESRVRCGGCGEYILSRERVEALGKSYHIDHFFCSSCSVAIVDSFSVNDQDEPICSSCQRLSFHPALQSL